MTKQNRMIALALFAVGSLIGSVGAFADEAPPAASQEAPVVSAPAPAPGVSPQAEVKPEGKQEVKKGRQKGPRRAHQPANNRDVKKQ